MLKQTLETPTNSSTHPLYGLSNAWNPGPQEFINWTVPEGGGGPQYPAM